MANLTYISKEIREIVRKNSPVSYKERLEKKISPEVIQETLSENALTQAIFTAQEAGVEKILSDRRKDMSKTVQSYYQSL